MSGSGSKGANEEGETFLQKRFPIGRIRFMSDGKHQLKKGTERHNKMWEHRSYLGGVVFAGTFGGGGLNFIFLHQSQVFGDLRHRNR